MNILIIDDDKHDRFILRRALEACECDISISELSDARDADHFIHENAIDITILDLKMPHFDGVKTLEKIRNNEKLAQHPVCILSGVAFSQAASTYDFSQATDFIEKPRNLASYKRLAQEICNKCSLIA